MSERIRFYADEHVPRAVVEGLRQRGVDILTVSDAGLLGASDNEHLAFALQQGRVLFTQEVDFLRLHSSRVGHAGIVDTGQGTTIGETIRGLVLVHEVLSPDEMKGHLEYL